MYKSWSKRSARCSPVAETLEVEVSFSAFLAQANKVFLPLTGLALGFFPAVGLALLAVQGLLERSPRDAMGRSLERASFVLGVFLIYRAWRIEENLAVATLQAALYWALARGWRVALRAELRLGFGTTIAVGLFISMVFVPMIDAVAIRKGFEADWNANKAVVKSQPYAAVFRAVPRAEQDDYIYRPAYLQGPGRLTFSVDVRAERRHRIALLVSSPALPNNFAEPAYCDVSPKWRRCSVSADLPAKGFTTVYVGGWGTWSRTSPALEVRSPKLEGVRGRTLLEIAEAFPRLSGWTFNANALGVTACLIGLLALALAHSWWISLLTITAALAGIAFSGSRGAMLGFGIGVFVLVLSRFKFRRWMPLLALLPVLWISVLQDAAVRQTVKSVAREQQGFRSFDIANVDTAGLRLDIWRVALRAWAQSPLTVVFGVGELGAVIRQGLPQHGLNPALDEPEVTHAHNLWVQILGETGLLGFGLMAGLWAWIGWSCWQRDDVRSLALLTAVFVVNSVDYFFFYTPAQVVFWACAVGLASHATRPNFEHFTQD